MDSNLVVPLELSLVFQCLWPLVISPASLPVHRENHRIWVVSFSAGPLGRHAVFPWASFVEQSLIIVYCVRIYYIFFQSATIIHLFYSSMIQFCTVRFLLFNYPSSIAAWLLFDDHSIIVHYHDTGNVFQVFWSRWGNPLSMTICKSINISTWLSNFRLSIWFLKAYCHHRH